MNTMVSPDYQTRVTPVSTLGVSGAGASIAVPSFVKRGYKVLDISSLNGDPLEEAKKKSAAYLVIVDPVGTSHAAWDGYFDYSLRVTETATGTIVWSATAEYGQSGLSINKVKSSIQAMDDIVEKFSKHFPPK